MVSPHMISQQYIVVTTCISCTVQLLYSFLEFALASLIIHLATPRPPPTHTHPSPTTFPFSKCNHFFPGSQQRFPIKLQRFGHFGKRQTQRQKPSTKLHPAKLGWNFNSQFKLSFSTAKRFSIQLTFLHFE